jgi:uncharacterized protein (UPF0276 family)
VPAPDWFSTLPTLGVGASLSFGVEPDPVALARAEGGPDFIEYAGAVQSALYRSSVDGLHRLGVPVLYHPSCLNLCGPWPNPRPWLDEVDAHVRAVGSPWLAQDVAVCFVGDTPGYSIQLGYFLGPVLTRASLDEAVRRVTEVRRAVAAPLLLEPPPALFRAGTLPMMAWLSELAERTDCGLLLDAGHVYSHALVEGADPLEGLDLDRVVEVHVAGGLIRERGGRRHYVDAHELPIQPEVMEVFRRILAGASELRAVCVECEGAAAAQVLPVLAEVRQAVALSAASPSLRAQVRAPVRSLPDPPVAPPAPAAPPPPPETPTGHLALLRLLFEPELRERLAAHDPNLAGELGVDPAVLSTVDPEGLTIDAEGRRQYLMSSLCRAFPLSSGCLGALLGADAVAAFLASPTLTGPTAARNAAFGAHLARLLELGLASSEDKRVVTALKAVLTMERALVQGARRLREAVEQGEAPPRLTAPGSKDRLKGTLELPPYAFVMELPVSPAVVSAALDGLSAADAWRRIDAGTVDADRLRAALRARPHPVTLLARSHAGATTLERGGGGGAGPVVEVSHRTAELAGRQGKKIQALAGESVGALSRSGRRLAEQLWRAGLLVGR